MAADRRSDLADLVLDAGTRRAIDLHAPHELDEDAFIELVREASAHNQS